VKGGDNFLLLYDKSRCERIRFDAKIEIMKDITQLLPLSGSSGPHVAVGI